MTLFYVVDRLTGQLADDVNNQSSAGMFSIQYIAWT